MNLPEAIVICEHHARIRLELANAERHGAGAKAAGVKHREIGTAIAMVLAALPEGARQ